MKTKILLIFLYLLVSCNRSTAIKTGLEGKPLPSFDFLLRDSTAFNSSNIPNGSPIILFYFSPTCPYCRAELKLIEDNITSLKRFRFYLLTPASVSAINAFYIKYNLKDYPNITVGFDYAFELGNYFNIKAVPYNAIYDAKRNLHQVIPGKASVEEFKAIENIN